MRAALLALLSTTRAYAHRIKHVVVLYEENRAFDHLLGHQKALKVDGLKGDESNPVDRRDPSKGSVEVFAGAPYVAVEQPRHGYAPYQMKLDVQDGVPRMDGYVEFERAVHKGNTSVADAVMQGFSDGAYPCRGCSTATYGAPSKTATEPLLGSLRSTGFDSSPFNPSTLSAFWWPRRWSKARFSS